MYFERGRLIRSLRIGLAILTSSIISLAFGIPYSYWIPITIAVVLFDQATVGGALNRSLLRITATIISAAVGLLTITLFKNNLIINHLVIILGSIIYAYFYMDKKNSYIGILGIITLVMMLLTDNNNITQPLFRCLDIIIGVIIAIIAMILVYPQYAKTNSLELLKQVLTKLETISLLFANDQQNNETLQKHFLNLEKNLLSDVVKFNRLIDETKFEVKNKTSFESYQNILLHFRRIYRLLSIVFYNHLYIDQVKDKSLHQEFWLLANVFNELNRQLENNRFNLNALKLNLDEISSNRTGTIFNQIITIHIINETNALISELSKVRKI